jgi:hypothetical protein
MEHESATSVAERLNKMKPEERREWFEELQFSLAFCSFCMTDMDAGQFICHCENDE